MENQLEEIIRIMTEQKAEIDGLRAELSEVRTHQKQQAEKMTKKEFEKLNLTEKMEIYRTNRDLYDAMTKGRG